MEEFFAIPFDEYRLPSFCSGCCYFYSTLPMAEEYAQRLVSTGELKEYVEALDRYKSGDKSARVGVAYSQYTLMTPVEVLAHNEFTHENAAWDHYNVWHCVYEMRAEKIKRDVLWLKQGDQYLRAAKYEFDSFGYVDLHDELEPLSCSSFWGIPLMLYVDGERIISSMYIVERFFETYEQALADIASPELCMENDLSAVCGCVFGDG